MTAVITEAPAAAGQDAPGPQHAPPPGPLMAAREHDALLDALCIPAFQRMADWYRECDQRHAAGLPPELTGAAEYPEPAWTPKPAATAGTEPADEPGATPPVDEPAPEPVPPALPYSPHPRVAPDDDPAAAAQQQASAERLEVWAHGETLADETADAATARFVAITEEQAARDEDEPWDDDGPDGPDDGGDDNPGESVPAPETAVLPLAAGAEAPDVTTVMPAAEELTTILPAQDGQPEQAGD